MLTKREADFIQEYKLTGNASEAVRRAGYNIKNPKSASVIACKLLKRPHVAALVSRASVNQELALVSPQVRQLPKEVSKLPTKEEYLLKAWQRSNGGEHAKKEETRSKYFEIAGKVMGVFAPESQQLNVFAGSDILADLRTRLNGVLPKNNTDVKHIINSDPETPQPVDNLNEAKDTNSVFTLHNTSYRTLESQVIDNNKVMDDGKEATRGDGVEGPPPTP